MSVTSKVYPSAMSTLPSIHYGRNNQQKDFRKPPLIPVTLNKRTMFKPYTMMYGDDIVGLKRMERTELADKTRSRNKMEVDRCWRNINLSYRDHLYAMGSIRQEQSLVYQLMCKVQKDKRKIQRQTHRRREEEFQTNMRWQRIKTLCHYVIMKFRQNVQRKKDERSKSERIPSRKFKRQNTKPQITPRLLTSQTKTSNVVTIEFPPLDVVHELPPLDVVHELPPNVQESEKSETEAEDVDISKSDESFELLDKSISINDISINTKSKSDLTSSVPRHDVVHSQYYQSVCDKSSTDAHGGNVTILKEEILATSGKLTQYSSQLPYKVVHDSPIQDGCQPSPSYQASTRVNARTKVIQVSKDKPGKPVTRVIQNIAEDVSNGEQRSLALLEERTDHKAGRHNQSWNSDETPVTSDIIFEINENVAAGSHFEESATSLNPVKVRRRGMIQPPTSYLISNQERCTKSANAATEDKTFQFDDAIVSQEMMCQDANLQHKEEQESLVHIMKKRARSRAKKDLELLNKESFVKYERTKSGLLKAYPGKRETFVPPTAKNVYTRNKLLRQERETMILQRFKLAKFYESVIELNDRPICHVTPVEIVEKKRDNELPALEDTPSQMTNSIFNTVQPDQAVLLDGKSSGYVRVYDKGRPDDVQYNNTDRRKSSWRT